MLGRGRWAKRLSQILWSEGRTVTPIPNLRQQPDEITSAYISRLTASLQASGAKIAWISTLPGPHVSHMIEASVLAGLDTIVEKPWDASRAETLRLRDLALARNRLVAFHYE
jgi:predicted dehydrogenase